MVRLLGRAVLGPYLHETAEEPPSQAGWRATVATSVGAVADIRKMWALSPAWRAATDECVPVWATLAAGLHRNGSYRARLRARTRECGRGGYATAIKTDAAAARILTSKKSGKKRHRGDAMVSAEWRQNVVRTLSAIMRRYRGPGSCGDLHNVHFAGEAIGALEHARALERSAAEYRDQAVRWLMSIQDQVAEDELWRSMCPGDFRVSESCGSADEFATAVEQVAAHRAGDDAASIPTCIVCEHGCSPCGSVQVFHYESFMYCGSVMHATCAAVMGAAMQASYARSRLVDCPCGRKWNGAYLARRLPERGRYVPQVRFVGTFIVALSVGRVYTVTFPAHAKQAAIADYQRAEPDTTFTRYWILWVKLMLASREMIHLVTVRCSVPQHRMADAHARLEQIPPKHRPRITTRHALALTYGSTVESLIGECLSRDVTQ